MTPAAREALPGFCLFQRSQGVHCMTQRKLFVLDTNVILHDSSCVYQFEEHDVVIPITVLEELDQFKKGKGILNFHAREFARSLDTISGDRIFNGGVEIGPGRGKLVVRLENGFHEKLRINFSLSSRTVIISENMGVLSVIKKKSSTKGYKMEKC